MQLNFTNQNRIYNLDVVRLFAALSVLGAHWQQYWDHKTLGLYGNLYSNLGEGLTRLLYGGHKINIGVLVFIVLSGFVIHLTTNVGQGNWRKAFVIHRLFRIWPLYILALVFGLLYAYLYNQLPENWVHISILNFLHLYAIYPIEPPIFNAPLVTVSTEIYLYAIYFMIANRLRSIKSWGGVLLLSFVIMMLNKFVQVMWYADTLTNIGDYWFNHSVFNFWFYWVLGAFLADLVKRGISIPLWPSVVIYLFAMWSVTLDFDQNVKATLNDIVWGIGISLVLGSIAQRLKGTDGSLQKFGESTYSLYALHTPLFYFLFQVTFPYSSGFVGAVLILLLTCLICFVNYCSFERYWIGYGKKLCA